MEIGHWITKAAAEDIALARSDFTITGGRAFLDGMPAGEWLEAMTTD